MHLDILFDTNRFNLSETRKHFINPNCFGEDLAEWLRAKLLDRGIPTIEPDQEDWGWYIEAKVGDASYFIGIGGNADETTNDVNQGEWRLMVQKHRTLGDKLSGKNRPSPDDPIFGVIEDILRGEPDIMNIRRE